MSIQRMRRKFAVQLRVVLWVITIAFIIGIPLVFVPGRIGRGGEELTRTEREDVIATVGDQAIRNSQVERQFDAIMAQIVPIYAQMGQTIGLEHLWRFRYDAIMQAVQQHVLLEAAKERGISVSRSDLRQHAQQMLDQEIAQIKAQYEGEDLQRMFATIAAQDPNERPRERMTERQFRRWAMDRLQSEEMGLRRDLTVERLRQSVVGQVNVTEEDLRRSFDTVTVRRIVITERDGKDEAREKAEALHTRLAEGEDFAVLARAESEDPMARETGGLQEGVQRGQMREVREEVVFALEPGQISEVIELPWAFEIVQLVERGSKLPEDFEENKETLMANFVEQRRMEAWQKFVEDLMETTQVEPVSAEMRAYKALMEGQEEETLTLLREARQELRGRIGPRLAAIAYQLATMLSAREEWEQAADSYAEAADALGARESGMLPGSRAQALLGLGRAQEKLGKLDEAIMWYTAAGDAAESPMIHEELLVAFRRLERDDLAQRQEEWISNYEQVMRQREEEFLAQQRELEEEMQRQEQTTPGPIDLE